MYLLWNISRKFYYLTLSFQKYCVIFHTQNGDLILWIFPFAEQKLVCNLRDTYYV